MTPDDIRRIALSFPDAMEADHHGMPSFRVGGKIFATIHVAQPRMMAKLDLEDQHNLSQGHPGLIEPVPGSWGRKGSTFLWYERADEVLVRLMLALAWRERAPKRLLSVPS
jgi:hypothetical protein